MKLDDVKKLHHKKYRNQLGYYLVEGEHLIQELQKAHSVRTDVQRQGDSARIRLYVTEDYQAWSSPFEKQVVSKKQMAQLSDTKTPQGIIACVPLPDKQASVGIEQTNERCIYLHEVQDPGNLGTILRTLAWFGDFRLLLSPNSVDPFNPKVVRSSMGAIFHVPMELDVQLDDLQNRFDRFAYLDMDGENISSPAFSEFYCYLFGNEARGVPHDALQALNAQAFTIPGRGAIESLNLAMAVNISAYQLSV
ncbi:RNA methyltransferase [Litoribacillus peritrichatus]|uniref:RNA methyltransferase n=1 Tax=Litoribacillus peritrichatus TaxID=718191 RepID=A0ABP7NC76_9GAMM